ncbi:MAG: C40 family peptidase [Ancrocorticia sp.]|uniref:C40 family peptidase n=1 Tax=Ancrocorticia sp. TaxID=2593684 RepID=UPI003F938623
MTGRHAITRGAALNTVNTPAGRGLIAAMAVGTAFGVTLPAANAAEVTTNDINGAAILTAKSDTRDATGGAEAEADSIPGVTTMNDVDWGGAEDVSFASEDKGDIEVQVAVEEPEPEPVVEEAAPAAETTTQAAEAPAQSEPAPQQAAPASGVSGIVGTAMSYTGSPYVWGGTTPSGWDCIGFVRYVFAQHGVSIGGYTTSVLSAGTQVPYSQAQAGDILYWPGHVAISLGNGQNVGAWNEGMGTRVGPDSWIGGTPTVIRVG